MATLRSLAISLASAAFLVRFAAAATYTVGGSNGGWDTSTNLQSWGAAQKLFVGDTLVFQYSPNHDVTEVSKPEYDSCQAANPIQTNNSGSTTVNLDSPGKRYFICTTPGHCLSGMKLEVDTLPASSSSSTSPESSPTPADAPSHSLAPIPSKRASAPSPSLVKAAAEGPRSGAGRGTVAVISIATGLVLGMMILLSA